MRRIMTVAGRTVRALAGRVRVLLTHSLFGFEPIVELVPSLDQRTLQWCLAHFGARIGSRCRILPGLVVHNAAGSFANLVVHDNVHIGRDTFIDLCERVEIGPDATVSMRCTIITHTDVGEIPPKRTHFPRQTGPVVLGHDTYIGAGATVLAGCEIHPHSVIAAGALVTRSVPEGSLCAGVPARPVRHLGPTSTAV